MMGSLEYLAMSLGKKLVGSVSGQCDLLSGSPDTEPEGRRFNLARTLIK